jgi:hypothetical protein
MGMQGLAYGETRNTDGDSRKGPRWTRQRASSIEITPLRTVHKILSVAVVFMQGKEVRMG